MRFAGQGDRGPFEDHSSVDSPARGRVLVAVVVMLRYTSAVWYFNDYSLPTL
jgi:hypothetical protein